MASSARRAESSLTAVRHGVRGNITVRTLHHCQFLDGAQNVVLIGGPDTGKTHVATALGIQAIEHHRRKVRFFSTVEQEKAKGI